MNAAKLDKSDRSTCRCPAVIRQAVQHKRNLKPHGRLRNQQCGCGAAGQWADDNLQAFWVSVVLLDGGLV